MLFMCLHRHRPLMDSDEVLLAPRRLSTKERDAALQFKETHNARIIEAHTQHQREITAVLDALNEHDNDDDIADGPPTISLPQPDPYLLDLIYLSGNESVPLPILVNGSAPTNISHILPPPPGKVPRGGLPHPNAPSAPVNRENQYSILPNRPRRSDPPDLDYSRYEIWNPVQNESHSIGGPDLPWKTGVIDLKIEADLLDDYIGWVRETRHDLRVEGKMISKKEIYGGRGWKGVNRGDRTFFAKLEKELLMDFREIARETNNHDERFGKEAEDSIVIWDLVERLEKEEMERKKAASAAVS